MGSMTEFTKGVLHPKPTVASLMEEFALSLEDACAQLERMSKEVVWINNRYQVNVFEMEDLVHLSIKRRDKVPIHDWRELQEIKNRLVGPENEGVELYPAESRVVDMANQYHLWVFKDPTTRIPFGFNDGRHIMDNPPGNAKQRPRDT